MLTNFFSKNERKISLEKSQAADIPAIMVEPSYQGKGVSKHLMQAMLKELKRQGIEEVYLSTSPDNVAATLFYQKMGFRHINTYEEYGRVKQNRYCLALKNWSDLNIS